MKNRSGSSGAMGLLSLLAFASLPGVAWAQECVACVTSAIEPVTRGDPATEIQAPDVPAPGWIAIAPERLDAMRGGFSLPSGLNLSFGIDRAVFIDGVLTTATSVNIANVGTMTTEEANALALATAPLLVQNGPGNIVAPGSGGAGLTIQNTLDNQAIRSLTTLNIAVNTLGMFQALHAQQAVQDALVGLSADH